MIHAQPSWVRQWALRHRSASEKLTSSKWPSGCRRRSHLPKIFKETQATKSLYGIDRSISENFGRQCLMARRFLESGVRFVQVTHSANKAQWDQHGNLRRDHAERAAQVDQPIAGLLLDLKARGLLDDTLVVWAGEFGRTPTVQGPKFDGRDHNPHGFTIWFAGAGVKKGFSYGATDEFGYYARENPVHVHDFPPPCSPFRYRS